MESLHPSTHYFRENVTIKTEFMEYLKELSKNMKAYNKQTIHEVDATTSSYIKGDYEEIEVGFIDGLFVLYQMGWYLHSIILLNIQRTRNTVTIHFNFEFCLRSQRGVVSLFYCYQA